MKEAYKLMTNEQLLKRLAKLTRVKKAIQLLHRKNCKISSQIPKA